MLQILLTILKILGILLLVIIGILLFVIVTVLFVPIRYSVMGEKYKADKPDGLSTQLEEEPQVIKAKVVVSWLAHLVHFRFRLQTKEKEDPDKKSKIKTDIKTEIELYVFGIPLFALKNKISAKRKKSKVKSTVENYDDIVGDTNQQETELFVEEIQKPVSIADGDNDEVADVLEEELGQRMDCSEVDGCGGEADTNPPPEKRNPIKNLIQKIKGIPQKIKATIENIKLTIKKLCDKIRAGSDFLKMESTKATIRLLLGKLKTIIVHILPKKLKGTAIFGFDDPALTGEILGVASLFYPKYQKTLKLIPVFEQQILEGKVRVKGRIVIAYIIWQAIKIVLDKNARLTLQNVKKLVAEIKK